jgi:hypothetical protein
MSKLIDTDPSNSVLAEEVVLKPDEEFNVKVIRRGPAFLFVIEIFERSADEQQGP